MFPLPPAARPPGYDGVDLSRVLKELEGSTPVLMDRWSVQVVTDPDQEEGDPVPYEIINNYFSIGVVSLPLVQLQEHQNPSPSLQSGLSLCLSLCYLFLIDRMPPLHTDFTP